jgi:hypothetical protein
MSPFYKRTSLAGLSASPKHLSDYFTYGCGLSPGFDACDSIPLRRND